MLILLAGLLVLQDGIRAQTQVPYHFPLQPSHVADGAGSYTANLTMGSLSANGLGQWTINPDNHSTGTHHGRLEWYLLGNNIAQAGTGVPPGIVDAGDLTPSPASDANMQFGWMTSVSNLNGVTAFICPSSDWSTFRVWIARDGSGDGYYFPPDAPLQSNFMDFDPSNSATFKVGRSPISELIPINVLPYVNSNCPAPPTHLFTPVLIDGVYEDDSRDVFNAAIDKNFLYFTWVSDFSYYQPNVNFPGSCDHWGPYRPNDPTYREQFFVVAIDLRTGHVASANYPFHFSAGAPTSGRRPSIACDVRNAPDNPEFYLAWIDQIGVGGGSSVQCAHCTDNGSGPTIAQLVTLQNKMFIPPHSSGSWLYYFPERIHLLVASDPNRGDHNPDIGVYIITPRGTGIGGSTQPTASYLNNGRGSLILHRFENGTMAPKTTADYVDGYLLAGLGSPLDPNTLRAWPFFVINSHITAFANPYDGWYDLGTAVFDEFHCLYQLDRSGYTPDITDHTSPLMIVRGMDNGDNPVVTGDHAGITDTRRCVNMQTTDNGTSWIFVDEPMSNIAYTAAANQMGIHVHWRAQPALGAAIHYYSRDTRQFDEPIEENTIASYRCELADGTSHGGSFGAEVNQSRTLSLWSDPSVFTSVELLPVSNSAILQSVHTQSTMGVTLGLSESQENPIYVHAPSLVLFPDFHIQLTGTDDAILIGQATKLNYWGVVNEVANRWGPFEGSLGTFTLQGAAGTSLAPGYPFGMPQWPPLVTLGIGTDFRIVNSMSFSAYATTFNFSSQATSYAPAKVTFLGCNVDIEGSYFWTGDYALNGIEIPLEDKLLSDPQHPFSPHPFTLYDNFIIGALPSKIALDGNNSTNHLGDVTITGGGFYSSHIFAEANDNQITISGSWFFDIKDYAISLFRDLTSSPPSSYSNSSITGCEFHNFLDASDKKSAIYLDGFTLSHPNMVISGNTFDASGTVKNMAAINIINSVAEVLANTIDGGTPSSYDRGIVFHSDQQRTSLICSNSIANVGNSTLTGAGILSDNFQGFCESNSVTSSDRGRVSGSGDFSYEFFDNYSGNRSTGVEQTSGASTIDMTQWTQAGTVWQAFTTVSGNGTSDGAAQIRLVPGSEWYRNKDNVFVSSGLLVDCPTCSSHYFIGGIGGVFWGSISLTLHPSIQGTGPGFASNIEYILSTQNTSSYTNTYTNLTCSGAPSMSNRKKDEDHTMSVLMDSISCYTLQKTGHDLGVGDKYQASYDTLMHFIDSCANESNAWAAFGSMSAANSDRNQDPNRYREFRDWLKKVLYYNLTSKYYCSDVDAMLSTFDFFDSSRGYDANGRCAVLKYLLQSGKCPDYASHDSLFYLHQRQGQHQGWIDTTARLGKDTNIYKLDTTLPSLEQLGLTTLYGPPGSVTPPIEAPNLLSGVRITDNPFEKTTDVIYGLSKDAAVEIEVFDVLGHVISGDDRVKVQSTGVHRVPLDLHSSPSGDYYVRLSANGRSTTLKMQKK